VLAIDSLHPLQLVAASGPGLGYGNVARSVDGGESWNVLQDAAMTIYPNELLVGSTGADFHAITANGFIYHYSLVHPRRRAAGK
jgi:hypothetical protein